MDSNQIHVLSGFLLVEDENGGLRPAVNDVSGQPLYAEERLAAATLLAEEGVSFLCVGCGQQTAYLKEVLPGDGHFAVDDPDRFPPNTGGNVEQLWQVNPDPKCATALLNLYHCFRWYELARVSCLPAEAVLTARLGWSTEQLCNLYGSGPVAQKLVEITQASAARLRNGEDGSLTLSELEMFNDYVQVMPESTSEGPNRDAVPEHIRREFNGSHLERFLDELIGVKDIRCKSYISYRPRPE